LLHLLHGVLGAKLLAACDAASKSWVPQRLPIEICLFRAAVSVWVHTDTSDPTMGWKPYAEKGVRCIEVPGVHGTLFHELNVSACANRLTTMLSPALGETPPGVVRWRQHVIQERP
jgi:hypothetical protein